MKILYRPLSLLVSVFAGIFAGAVFKKVGGGAVNLSNFGPSMGV